MPKIITGVFGLAFNDKHQALLTERFQPESPEAHLKWQVPGGGQDFGEHPLDTLKREMYEEVGVRVEVLDERPMVYVSIWNVGKPDEVQVNLLVYLVSIGTQTPSIEADVETNDWRWVDLEELETLPQLPQLTAIVRRAHEIFLAIS